MTTRNTYTATYSPEDNKLRLYTAFHLDDELYQRVKKAGFKYAPKQKLFVAPMWTTEREDLLIELAGEIEPEQTTLLERAELKAERLEGYASKREAESNAYYRAASSISERFAGGQPILVGHHSEAKARSDQKKMHNAMSASVKAADTSKHWLYKAASVERHATYKNRKDVRERRIKKLLTELRDLYRPIHTAYHVLDYSTYLRSIANEAELYNEKANLFITYSDYSFTTRSKWENKEISAEEAINIIEQNANSVINSETRKRWIEHTLNRLGYENSFLIIDRFEEKMTGTILQVFARTHGTEKPKAEKVAEGWLLKADTPLPLHLTDFTKTNELLLTEDQWRDLMFDLSYEVPAKKPTKPPILNFKCATLTKRNLYHYHQLITYQQREITEEDYQHLGDRAHIALSADGLFRFRVGRLEHYYDSPTYAFFITDAKVHPAPASEFITY